MRKKPVLLALIVLECILVALLVRHLTVTVYNGACGDNLTWHLDRTTGVLTVSGSGEMKPQSSRAHRQVFRYWNDFQEKITSVSLPRGLTNIPFCAFYGCVNLTEVEIPDTVTRIESAAFADCAALTGVTIPEGVTRIEGEAFGECGSLREITIPTGVTSLDSSVFRGCGRLTDIHIDPENPCYCSEGGVVFSKDKTRLILCSGGLAGAYSIPEGVTALDDGAFAECAALTGVTVPGSVRSIGNYAFQNCRALTGITLCEGVETVGDSAFKGCAKLKEIVCPASVTRIGCEAIFSCPELTRVTVLNPSCMFDNDALYAYGGTLCGYEGSSAERYARDHGITFEYLLP